MVEKEILTFFFVVSSYVCSALLLFRYRESGVFAPGIYSSAHISLASLMFVYLTFVCIRLITP